MNFKTIYDKIYNKSDEDCIYSNVGSRFHDTFSLKIDKDGKKVLSKKGTIDVYQEIQSHADSVDIHKIIDRFNNGDLSVLDNGSGYYCDITQMPKTYAEMIQRMQDAEVYFKTLPVEVRAKFNHDVNQFIMADFGGVVDGSGPVSGNIEVSKSLSPESPDDKGNQNIKEGA